MKSIHRILYTTDEFYFVFKYLSLINNHKALFDMRYTYCTLCRIPRARDREYLAVKPTLQRRLRVTLTYNDPVCPPGTNVYLPFINRAFSHGLTLQARKGNSKDVAFLDYSNPLLHQRCGIRAAVI